VNGEAIISLQISIQHQSITVWLTRYFIFRKRNIFILFSLYIYSSYSFLKSEVALFYIEHKDVDVETILGDCFIAPTMVGFVVPHDRGDHYR
jgi:hypothetical protein